MSEQTIGRFRRNMPPEQDQMNVQNGLDEVTSSFGMNNPPPESIEKSVSTVTPEELFEVEQAAIGKAIGDYPTMISTKLEEEERHLEELEEQLRESRMEAGGGPGAAAAGAANAGAGQGSRAPGGSPDARVGQGGRAPSQPGGSPDAMAGQGARAPSNIGSPDALAGQAARGPSQMGSPDVLAGQAARDPPPTPPTGSALGGQPPTGPPAANTPGLQYTLAYDATTKVYTVEVSVNGQFYGTMNLSPDFTTAVQEYSGYNAALQNPTNSVNAGVLGILNQGAYNNMLQSQQFGNTPETMQPSVSVMQNQQQIGTQEFSVYAGGTNTVVGTVKVNPDGSATFTAAGAGAGQPQSFNSVQDFFTHYSQPVGSSPISQGGGNITPPGGSARTPTSTTPTATPDELASVTQTPTGAPVSAPHTTPPSTPNAPVTAPPSRPAVTPAPAPGTHDTRGGKGEEVEEVQALRKLQEEAGAGAGGGHGAGRGSHGGDADTGQGYGEGGTQTMFPTQTLHEEGEAPQIPGAASQPQAQASGQPQQPKPAGPSQPRNPFQNYQPPQQQPAPQMQPTSGLPWKPPGAGGGMKRFNRNRHKSLFDDYFFREVTSKHWVTLSGGRKVDIGGDAEKAKDGLAKRGYKLQTVQRTPSGKNSEVWNHPDTNHNVYLTHDGGQITEAHSSSDKSFFRG